MSHIQCDPETGGGDWTLDPWCCLLQPRPSGEEERRSTQDGEDGLTGGGVTALYGSPGVEGGRRRVRATAMLVPRGVDATKFRFDAPRSHLQSPATAPSLPAFKSPSPPLPASMWIRFISASPKPKHPS